MTALRRLPHRDVGLIARIFPNGSEREISFRDTASLHLQREITVHLLMESPCFPVG